ncbi:MAG: hypothetical protein GF308_10520 [Candidatus Heimdallarchaeota archaeon]|nr:hypothetical protein [Candidatus Heimdallarchaeota archaeon]
MDKHSCPSCSNSYFKNLWRRVVVLKDILETTTQYCNNAGVEYAEVRVSKLLSNLVQVRNSDVARIEPSASSHASVRVFDGAWGFTSINMITKENLQQAADQAIKLAENSRQRTTTNFDIVHTPPVNYSNISRSSVDPREGSIEELQEIILESAKAGLEIDERINRFIIQCVNDLNLNYYANTDGSWIETFCPTTYLIMVAIAKEGAVVKRKRNRLIVSASSEVLAYSDPLDLAQQVAKETIGVLSAKKHPSGNMPIIIDNFLSGTLCSVMSTSLKATTHLYGSGTNFFKDKINEQISSEAFNLSNEPNLEGMPVYYEYDVEGVKAQSTPLIKDGILQGFIHDKTTAAILNAEPSGCSRAVDAAHPPVPEFGNVIVETGDYSLPEMLEGISEGIYATGLAGASTVGSSTMITSEGGFLIKNGELTDRLDQISFSVDLVSDLHKIDAIGNDFSPSSIHNYSGAYYALIGTGSPHLRINEVAVK